MTLSEQWVEKMTEKENYKLSEQNKKLKNRIKKLKEKLDILLEDNKQLKERIDKTTKDLQELIDRVNNKTIIGLNEFISRLEVIQDELAGDKENE